ncbi:MAG TPA: hypothetical protein VGL61_10565 [Kofleriaceae bacterium]|jgi:hypothetical protein
MFGAPLLVIAQALQAVAYLLDRAIPRDISRMFSPSLIMITALVLEMLGFLDLSYRTRGAARVLTRALAVVPILMIAAVAIGATIDHDLSRVLAQWAYALYACFAVIALWLVARRAGTVAVGALALVFFVNVVPRFQLGIVNRLLRGSGVAGELLLVYGSLALFGVLAVFAGRAADPVRFDHARTRRSLVRAPIAIALLAAPTIVELFGDEPAAAAVVAAFFGGTLLAFPAYRMRTRSIGALVAVVLAIYAALLFGDAHDTHTSVIRDVVVLAAIGSLVVGVARRRYVIAFAVIGAAALALHGRPISLALELAAEVVAAVALVGAGRALKDAPTVAEVFA